MDKPRNYAPKRIFISKWDVEKDRNQIKRKSIQRERRFKYEPVTESVWVIISNAVFKPILKKEAKYEWEVAFPWP